MADIDRQRIAAVRTLQALGYLYHDGEWLPPATAATPLSSLTDAALCAALTELKAIVDLIESYEAQRSPQPWWQFGRDPSVPGWEGAKGR